MSFRRFVASLCVVFASLTACSGSSPTHPEPVAMDWREISLPFPPGPPGHLAVRDAIHCGDSWYITGAVFGTDGVTRPAAWRSVDATAWTPLGFTFTPDSYYGRQSIVYAVGCADGRLAAIGARSGGAHGNPRVRTWTQLPDGSLTEVDADFEVYGGPNAVAVSRIAGGPAGWLIAGTRLTGAAVWTSPDATDFRIHEGVPELRSDDRGRTWATDAVADERGWVVVGAVSAAADGASAARNGGADPMVWESVDAQTWRRVPVPGGGAYEELQRVAPSGAGLIAIGRRGDTFGAWVRTGGTWAARGTFGSTDGAVPPGIEGLTVGDEMVFAATRAGDGHRLWMSDVKAESWAPVGLPAAMTTTHADAAMAIAVAGDVAVLVADDGAVGRAWTAPLRRTS